MNILYVGTLPPHPGGSAISGYQLLCGLAGLGHEVRALAPITPAAKNRGRQFDQAHSEIAVERFEVPHFEVPPHFPYSAASVELERTAIEKSFAALITQDRPDIVLIGRETYARYVPGLAHASGIPCSLIIRGGLTHRIIDGTHPPDSARQLLDRYREVDLLITPAHHMAESLKKLGVEASVIRNAVNLRLFSRSPDRESFRSTFAAEDDVVVAYVGHLRPLKRSLDLVHIAEAALSQRPDFKFLIVGDGPLREEMQEACHERGIADRFHFVGWVEHASVPPYIDAADVVLTPTAIENQALIYLEAQASGRLLLASDIPAAREVVVDGENGLLFAVGDVADCVAKLMLAAGDSQLRASIEQRAQRTVQRHGLEHVVAAYSAALHDLVNRA